MKKILSAILISMCLTISSLTFTVGAIQAQNNDPKQEAIQPIDATIDLTNNKDIDLENFLNSYNNDDDLPPGIYIFQPCNDIFVEGEGMLQYNPTSNGNYLQWWLYTGAVNVNQNEFEQSYEAYIIVATGNISNFEGQYTFEDGDISIQGSGEWCTIQEQSYLMAVFPQSPILGKGETAKFDVYNVGQRKIELENPHFYIYDYDLKLLSDEMIETTFELPVNYYLPDVWSWNQKDQQGTPVQGKQWYLIFAEITINVEGHESRAHPNYFMFYILGIKNKQQLILPILFNRLGNVLPQFENIFPLMQKISNILS